jgi:hypothetical protein
VAAAAWSIARDPAASFAVTDAGIAFPALHANPDAAAKLVLMTGAGRFTFNRIADGSWVALDKHGYAVSARRIRAVATQLADMRRIEAKTALPERFAQIGVEAPDTPKANAAMVRLENAAGDVLVETILGERVWRQTGPARTGTFIRAPDGERAWLASGGVDLPADLIDWLDRAIVNIDGDEVAKVEVIPATGSPFLIARKVLGSDFSLLSAKGPLRLDTEAAKKLSTGLARLTFEDVVPSAQKAVGADRSRVDVTTFDGLKVTIVFIKEGARTWARFSAEALASGKTDPAAAKARAAKINARVAPWTYRIAEWQRAKLAVPLDRLMARAKK